MSGKMVVEYADALAAMKSEIERLRAIETAARACLVKIDRLGAHRAIVEAARELDTALSVPSQEGGT